MSNKELLAKLVGEHVELLLMYADSPSIVAELSHKLAEVALRALAIEDGEVPCD